MTDVTHDDGALTVAGSWTYQWGARKRPALHPVHTPAGHLLTRDAPEDHPWHHGLWFTIKLVDDDNFWEEMPPYGVLRHDGPPAVTEHEDGRVDVQGRLTWTRPDRTTVAIEEDRRLSHVPLGDDAYAIDLSTTLVPTADTVLDRTPFTTWGGYGGLALRGPGDWRDTRLTLSTGEVADRVIGEPATWCDLTGTADADGAAAPAGVAMFDAPTNRRHPVPWYASTRAATYGDEGWSNFANAAFLFHEPLALAAGEPLQIDHRVVVHDGVWSAERLDEAYQAWTAELGG
ncbi:MAG: hypothetical protein JWM05_2164 [Acidimicrobiales bacterium]|nr:hypothetical protein [Acidimicrobiales bacterium]